MKRTTGQSFSFPIFCVLFIVYSLIAGLPSYWWLWAFVAVLLDFIINPIYKKITVVEEE